MTIYHTREGTRLVLNQQKRGHWNRWGRCYRSGLGAQSVKITALTEKRGVISNMIMPGRGHIAGMKTASRESATVINTLVALGRIVGYARKCDGPALSVRHIRA